MTEHDADGLAVLIIISWCCGEGIVNILNLILAICAS